MPTTEAVYADVVRLAVHPEGPELMLLPGAGPQVGQKDLFPGFRDWTRTSTLFMYVKFTGGFLSPRLHLPMQNPRCLAVLCHVVLSN